VDTIKKVLVVGAGTMGNSLAFLYARGGFEVTLVDKNPQALERALKLIKSTAGTMVKGGVISEQEAGEIPKRVRASSGIEEAGGNVDLAVETVDEDPATKKLIFSLLDEHCPEHAILTSNTSALNVFEIIEVKRPERVAITHFFAPPHIIPLVEVIPHKDMSPEVVQTILSTLESLGKTTLLLKEYIPGFIVNRIQRAIARESFSLVDRGIVSVEEMDKAVKASLGIRLPVVGIMQTYDFTGLDTTTKIGKETRIDLAPATGPSRTISEKLAKGEFGVKTGKGLYDYSGRTMEEVLETRDLNYLRILRAIQQTEKL
jgi:3-hydroxybutyryl-CoA dehydrogenase